MVQGTAPLCLKKVIIAHIPHTLTDGNADLAAMDTLSPAISGRQYANAVNCQHGGSVLSGMSQSHRQSCNQVQQVVISLFHKQHPSGDSAVFQCVIFQPARTCPERVGAVK